MENDFEEEYFSANEFQDQSDDEYFSANEEDSLAISVANGLRDYSDVEYYFREYPTAVLQVRMPSGQIATLTQSSFNDLLWEHEGDYRDQEGYDMANFKVISVIRNNEEVNRRIREARRHRRQPDLGGIDDVRFKVKEKYVEGDYYCPTNNNCVGKCIMKYLEIMKMFDLIPKVIGLIFDNTSTIPQMNVLLKKEDLNIRVISYTNRDCNYYKEYITVPIYKCEIKKGYYHSVLILDSKKYREKKPEFEVECGYVELEDLSDLSVLENGEKLKEFKEVKNKRIKMIAFDFETRIDKNVKVGVLYKQVPYLSQFGNDRKVEYCFDLENPHRVVDKMMEYLKEELITENRRYKKGDYSVREITVVGFNNSKFDNHILLEYLRNDEWEVTGKFLGDETVIKQFSMQCKTLKFYNRVIFKDLLLFLPGMNLERACKTYDCKNLKFDKKDFDIKNHMTKETILPYKEKIIDYGIQDVKATYELGCRYNKNMEKTSGIKMNVLSKVSLPNCADKIRDCYHDKEIPLYYNKRKEVADFERSSVIGGRVVAGSLKCDEPLIAVDANSLYPSAMKLFDYPVGKRTFYNRELHPEKMEEYKNKLNKGEEILLCIMKIKFKINNECLMPMLPVRDCKDKESLIQMGVYTSVELEDAVYYGKFEILEVMIVLEFEGKAKIFEKFVDVFYGRRKEYKRGMKGVSKDSNEYKSNNIMQDQCKLLMNSSYGSLVMKSFDYVYQFISEEKFERDYDETLTPITMSNGKYFVKYKNNCHHDNTKCVYLGAFILSYARRIMNQYIYALNGFFKHEIEYMDTDSMYIRVNKYGLLEEKGYIGDELGQCKNDYGEGVVIVKFRCIGKKMKLCWLNNDEIKTTFKGLKGLRSMKKEEKIELFESVDKVIESGSKEVFKEITYETMKRSALQVNVIESKRSFRMTAYSQYQVDKDYWCYPLYYNLEE